MKELDSIEKLIDSLSLFPTIGTKSAERMAYALLDMDEDDIRALINNIANVKNSVHPCPECGVLTDKALCSICEDLERDHSVCMVVATPKDVFSFEKTGNYDGVYHVLGGLINLSKNVGPEKLNIEKLINKIKTYPIKEIILATPGTPEGEITSLYLAKILKNEDVTVTRLGYGIPMGSSLEYVDSLTIDRAIKNRTKL